MSTGPIRIGLSESSHVNVALAEDRMVLKHMVLKPDGSETWKLQARGLGPGGSVDFRPRLCPIV